MVKTKATFLVFFLIPLALTAQQASWKNILHEVQQQYASDRRVAVFDVTGNETTDGIALSGEVDNPAAKNALIEMLKEKTRKAILDHIRVLPDESIGEKIFGVVTVSVGNMRTKPGEAAELSSQVLMGMAVKILKRSQSYWYVQSPDHYLGWFSAEAMRRFDAAETKTWNAASKVIMTEIFGVVREQPSQESSPVCDLVALCVLNAHEKKNGWIAVELADGRKGYVQNSLVQDYDEWKSSRQLTASNLEKSAKALLGIPYLWGGTSTKGVDCSGFTKTVYCFNGKELARDASQQAAEGVAVDVGNNFQNLQKGDLLFFGRKANGKEPEHIIHVAMYLENKLFIHSIGRVRYGSFDHASPFYDASLEKSFVRARRMISDSPSSK
jgi:gamma-D-glutamyl-L-lysine dipeptidyl-peptidase